MSTAESRSRRRDRIARTESAWQAAKAAVSPVTGHPRVQAMGGLAIIVGSMFTVGAIEQL